MDGTPHIKPDRFTAGALVLAGIGLAMLAIAIASALWAIGIDGQPDDVLFEVDGQPYPGPIATTIRVSMAIGLGAGGVFCLLKFWRDLTRWRRDS